MPKTMPGTELPWSDKAGDNAFSLLQPTFSLSGGGLSLSQLSQLTGLSATGIQNWVKRGWVPHPAEKKYGEFQVARVLLLNLLRPAMQLERIVALLAVLNGRVDDPSDDSISEVTLYNMICAGIRRMEIAGTVDKGSLERLAQNLFIQYGVAATEQMRSVLTVMLLSMAAAQLIREADALYETVEYM